MKYAEKIPSTNIFRGLGSGVRGSGTLGYRLLTHCLDMEFNIIYTITNDLGGMIIRPDRVFERIKNIITSTLPESEMPLEFKIDFQLMPQTLQFDMLDEKQTELIIEVVKEMVIRLHDMAVTSNTSELEYIMTYPFEARTEMEKAIVVIEFHYREDGAFTGERIVISRAEG